MAASPQITPTASALPPGHKLGEYIIQSVLGHGGFGITYLAKDTRLASLVAIKEYFPQAYSERTRHATIRPIANAEGALESYRWGLQQFLKEAQALAQFKHNHIVRVLRFLEANGTAYMVMEYEEGEALTGLLRKHGGFLNEPTLLGIFLPILGGLQAVHDAGLLHLDIKPDNIYMRANGQPMLIDFGSARRAKTGDAGERISLTPGFCAIEQYPNHGEVGPWSDVYSIGATLYRCITGRLPTDARERQDVATRTTVDPLPPATSFDRPLYTPCIRTTIDRALCLNADDRPQSAFALQQGLMGKDIAHAKPTAAAGYRYRSGFIGVTAAATARKPRRRYSAFEKFIVTLVFIASALVVTPKILIDTQVYSEDELLGRIQTLPATLVAHAEEWRRTIDARVFGKHADVPSDTSAVLAPTPALVPPTVIATPNFDPVKQPAGALLGHTASIAAVAFTSDGTRLISSATDGVVKIWDVARGEVQKSLPVAAVGGAFALSPDARQLALPGDDRIIHLWDMAEAIVAGRLNGHAGAITALVYAPDGTSLLSTADDGAVLLWDVARSTVLHRLDDSARRVVAAAFAPNGRVLVAGDSDGGILYLDAHSFTRIAYSPAHPSAVTALAFSPDGTWLASGANGVVKLWRLGVDARDITITDAPATVHALTWSPDGKYLLAVGTGDTVHVWDARTGSLVRRLTGPQYDTFALALSPDGRVVAAGGDDNTIRLWK